MRRLFRFYTDRIGGKIVVPYLVLIFVVALLATYVVLSLVSTSIFDKFREDLADGGRAANEAMLKIEADQLASVREMTFTEGVEQAITQRDTTALQRLLGPLQVNARIGYVDVFDASGQQVFAMRPQEREADAARLIDPAAARWPPVQAILSGQVDALGDKQAGLVRTAWGEDVIYTAGPIRSATDERVVGVIAVGSPLAVVVSRLSQESVMGVTLYDTRGAMLASTVRGVGTGVSVPTGDVQAVTREGKVITRPLALEGDRVLEMLGTLTIRREPAALMGVSKTVSLVEETGTRTRDVLIAVFSLVALFVLVVGLLLAYQLTRPIGALVRATERVRVGDLDVEVPVTSRDETGVLAREFNSMVGGLRERNRARDAFGRYFSDDFYELVRDGRLELGGEKREITIIMSDIRAFTTISERMDPGALVSFLNEYFALQVDAIKRHGGEVDKYMGDAILAKFGAPVWYPDHARRAVLAMLDMRAGLAQFNHQIAARGLPPIRIGIGGNTGDAVVGNIGSTQRMEYTIIGDAVNATQRIGDLCKDLAWDLLISDTTYDAVRDLVAVGPPTPVRLRGRSTETLVYPLLGLLAPGSGPAAWGANGAADVPLSARLP